MSVSIKARLIRDAFALVFAIAAATCALGQPKRPVIIIPGLTGSELVNSKTGEKVWFKLRRSKGDDLRLPVSANILANRDSLVAGDIIREVGSGLLPRTDVYGGLIDSLVARGYLETRWDAPPTKEYEKALYVFPYDWRRDNVENSRLLIRRIEGLKKRLKRPDLKFDVIAHSMGGLIARYAAMYGNADLSSNGKPAPTWSGARHMANLVIIGTPNEGSPLSLKNLINGFRLFGIDINLPFVQNLSSFDVFTIPAAYELLPAQGSIRAFDQDLKPLDIDVYDVATWKKYGWDPIDDKDFAKEFTPAERRAAPKFFAMMLDRARRFQTALAVRQTASAVSINVIGSDCTETLDAMVLYQKKDGKWETIFKADSFENAAGRKVTSEELKALIYGPGDGVVTWRSLEAATVAKAAGSDPIFSPTAVSCVCENHDKLPANVEVQAKLFAILSAN